MESEKYNYFYKFIDKLQLTWLQKQKEKNYNKLQNNIKILLRN